MDICLSGAPCSASHVLGCDREIRLRCPDTHLSCCVSQKICQTAQAAVCAAQIINAMGGQIEKQQDNNGCLSYWLSNTVTLLYLSAAQHQAGLRRRLQCPPQIARLQVSPDHLPYARRLAVIITPSALRRNFDVLRVPEAELSARSTAATTDGPYCGSDLRLTQHAGPHAQLAWLCFLSGSTISRPRCRGRQQGYADFRAEQGDTAVSVNKNAGACADRASLAARRAPSRPSSAARGTRPPPPPWARPPSTAAVQAPSARYSSIPLLGIPLRVLTHLRSTRRSVQHMSAAATVASSDHLDS